MEKTAVDWLCSQIYTIQVEVEAGNNCLKMKIEQAKEMERIQKIKIQIQENESILEMLRIHGSDASIIRVFSRLESLKEELNQTLKT